MNIHLKPEQERIIQEAVRSGRFGSAEEVVAEALDALKQRTGSTTADGSHQADAVREMMEFVESHRVRLEGINVRQLIHEGHNL